MPYAFSMLTLQSLAGSGLKGKLFLNHELNDTDYFALFFALAFSEMKFRKEKGIVGN
jgi:hypothetical protein